MKVTFCTCNAYTIIYSYLLQKKYYKNEKTTLIISDLVLPDYAKIAEKIKNLEVFDNVHIIKEKGIEDIENRCKEILNEENDRFHIYTFGSSYNRWVLENGKGQKIMTDEGVATYIDLTLDEKIDIEKIDEVWIGNIDLYCGKLLKDKLVQIDMIDFIEENIEGICKDLNYIFGIKDEEIQSFPKKIFLDQYLKGGVLSNEEIILGKVLNPILINENIQVKMHPTQSKYIEKFSDNITINNYNVPFELFILNRLKKEKLNKEALEEISIYTITSSAAISYKLLVNKPLNIKNYYFLNLCCDRRELNERQIKLVKKLQEVYNDNIHIINNVEEFRQFYDENKYEISLIGLYNLYIEKLNKEYLEKILLSDKLFKLPRNSKIAIWGAGNIGIELLDELIKNTNFNICCIIDNVKKGDINGVPIISQYDIDLSEIKFIINTTISCKYAIEEYLKRFNYRNYVSIY